MNAFEIRNLACAYQDGQVVLEVPYLDLSFGNIIVFLGPSGVGKSTLLETLGLMNHTISKGCVRFKHEPNDFLSLWEGKGEISSVRNEHMSFIFQENNLLENISALENAMMPLLIQGTEEAEAEKIVLQWCQDLDLKFINKETKVSQLSVGQKQRLAFIRAASPHFTVLFGDEPTGNLDEKNGAVLMEALRNKITESNNKILSIIVSHDIDLAIKYADQVVVLTKKDTRKGQIKVENIYLRDKVGWKASDKKFTEDIFRKHIADLL